MTMWWIFCRWKIRLPSVFNHKNNTRYCIRVGLKPKAKNKGDDEIGRFTPSNWPKSQNEAQETGWAGLGLRFSLEPVQTERFEAKNKSEDEIGRFTPSDWSKLK